jgi:phosphoadenosine phosphosulfate reductase
MQDTRAPHEAGHQAGASNPALSADPVHLRALELNTSLAHASPEDIVATAADAATAGRFAIVSSFGAESAILLAAAAQVDRSIPVLMIDTGYLFPETLAYRDLLQERLGLSDMRALTPDALEAETEDPEGDLFTRDTDACCALRKVRPLSRALEGFDVWANGRKRYQGASRADIPVVEADGSRLKFNPLALLGRSEVVERFRKLGLPLHPLEKFGYASIGCMPCTSRVAPGEDPRAGRWRGEGKVECGLHTGTLSARQNS